MILLICNEGVMLNKTHIRWKCAKVSNWFSVYLEVHKKKKDVKFSLTYIYEGCVVKVSEKCLQKRNVEEKIGE